MKNNQVDVKDFITYCEELNSRKITRDVAIQISNDREELIIPYWNSLNAGMKILVAKTLFNGEQKDIGDSLIIISINNFGLDSDWKTKAKVLHEGIMKCVKKCIEKIDEVRSAGYDWDLIVKMLDEENIFRKWLEWGDAEERLKEIKAAFGITN